MVKLNAQTNLMKEMIDAASEIFHSTATRDVVVKAINISVLQVTV
jgi:hypothetical protein